MRSRYKLLSFLAMALIGTSSSLRAAAPVKTLEIGQSAPGFCLPGVDGKEHCLKDYADAKVLVIVFTCNHCPTAQAYEKRIQQLATDYAKKGVALVAISPNDDKAVRLNELGYTDLSDSLDEMIVRAKERGFTFPYLYDGKDQKVSRAYGPVATPHVFIFDSDRKLQYVGRIDDSAKPQNVTSRDAQLAIDALLSGRPVPVAKTRTFGCSIKWADKRGAVQTWIQKWNKETATLKTINQKSVRDLVDNRTNKLRLINLWATWCAPCRAEFPELIKIHRMYRKRDFEVITISSDLPEQRADALEFLNKQHASCVNYLFQGKNEYELADAIDPKWQGALPYTMLVAPGGKILYRKQDRFDPRELKRIIADALGRVYP